jgi:hypothetical protein
MRVGAARAAAVERVQRTVAQEKGFVGAYFSGSTVYLPSQAEVAVGSDVDVMVASERVTAAWRTKVLHAGALIEASHVPWSAFSSVDSVPSAHSLRFDTIISDPRGWLAGLQPEVPGGTRIPVESGSVADGSGMASSRLSALKTNRLPGPTR